MRALGSVLLTDFEEFLQVVNTLSVPRISTNMVILRDDANLGVSVLVDGNVDGLFGVEGKLVKDLGQVLWFIKVGELRFLVRGLLLFDLLLRKISSGLDVDVRLGSFRNTKRATKDAVNAREEAGRELSAKRVQPETETIELVAG